MFILETGIADTSASFNPSKIAFAPSSPISKQQILKRKKNADRAAILFANSAETLNKLETEENRTRKQSTNNRVLNQWLRENRLLEARKLKLLEQIEQRRNGSNRDPVEVAYWSLFQTPSLKRADCPMGTRKDHIGRCVKSFNISNRRYPA